MDGKEDQQKTTSPTGSSQSYLKKRLDSLIKDDRHAKENENKNDYEEFFRVSAEDCFCRGAEGKKLWVGKGGELVILIVNKLFDEFEMKWRRELWLYLERKERPREMLSKTEASKS